MFRWWRNSHFNLALLERGWKWWHFGMANEGRVLHWVAQSGERWKPQTGHNLLHWDGGNRLQQQGQRWSWNKRIWLTQLYQSQWSWRWITSSPHSVSQRWYPLLSSYHDRNGLELQALACWCYILTYTVCTSWQRSASHLLAYRTHLHSRWFARLNTCKFFFVCIVYPTNSCWRIMAIYMCWAMCLILQLAQGLLIHMDIDYSVCEIHMLKRKFFQEWTISFQAMHQATEQTVGKWIHLKKCDQQFAMQQLFSCHLHRSKADVTGIEILRRHFHQFKQTRNW